MRKCLICKKGNLVKVEDIVLEVEGHIFTVKGERCTSCKEEFLFEEETKRTITMAKKLRIWPEPLKLHQKL